MTSRLEELRYKWATTPNLSLDDFNILVIELLRENDELYKTLEEVSNRND